MQKKCVRRHLILQSHDEPNDFLIQTPWFVQPSLTANIQHCDRPLSAVEGSVARVLLFLLETGVIKSKATS
jgi:hypothetical protein